MTKHNPVTMAEIAARAGVALSTVSYALSGKRSVSEEMRQRVLAAVEELHYRPHGPARPPRAAPPARSRSSSRRHSGTSCRCSRRSLPARHRRRARATTRCCSRRRPLSPDAIARLVATGRADGVILMELLAHDPRVERLQGGGHPFTLIGRTADTTGISFVDLDYGDAVEKSLMHLADLGHRCVALFNFPPDQLEAGYTSGLIARTAFEAKTAELGVTGIHLPCQHPRNESFAVAAELLRSTPECTAAITTGWQFTGLLGALREAGLHVPDDFSLVSVIASQYAEMMTPELTGVEWPAFEAGRLAAEMLIERLAGGGTPPHQLLIRGRARDPRVDGAAAVGVAQKSARQLNSGS